LIDSLLPADFDRQVFLRDYWQKKLAGLACEEGAESRFITVSPTQDYWELKQGPFTEEFFLGLPETHYSLLVQAVDQWVDDVAVMLADFDFIPGWRIDDIMVSYATDQGNVGPHFDYYDVFLIQGMGQKRWQIGGLCNSLTAHRDDSGLRLLKDFVCDQEWIVNPGDILYLPPGISHYGVALGNSMTYSVGFRAPSYAEILNGLTDEALDMLSEDQRYTDRELTVGRHPGEISVNVIQDLQTRVLNLLADPAMIQRWFGKTMTCPKYPVEYDEHCCDRDHQSLQFTDFVQAMKDGAQLYKVPGSRFAYARSMGASEDAQIKADDKKAELFADGEVHLCNLQLLPLLQALSTPGHVEAIDEALISGFGGDTEALQLLYTLYNRSCLVIDWE
jgi:50S ribosomal protein L16 3-hydroxylase